MSGSGGSGRAQSPPRAAAAAAAAAARKGGRGEGGTAPASGKGGRGPGGPPFYGDYGGGKGRYSDDAKGGKGGTRAARRRAGDAGENPVKCCEPGCPYRGKTPQCVAGHHAYKHGSAPFSPQELSKEEWEEKRQRSTDAVVKATGVRPGEPGWHIGNHVGAGGGWRRDRRSR